MKTIFKILFSVILLTNSQELFAQQDDLANKFTTGKYISKTEADDYLGVWKSVDGNYTILLTKEIKKYKTDVVNFSIDELVVKIIDPKVEKNKQILNNSYYLSITSGYANNIFTDPTTNYEYELRVIFTKRDEIKLYATPVFDVGKKQHSYFPNNIVFYRLKK